KLHIVYNQHIGTTIKPGEISVLFVADSVQKLLHKLLTRNVHHMRGGLFGQDGITNRLDEVGFANSDAAINEQRVVFGARRLRNRLAGGIRQLITRAYYKVLKRITLVQAL